MNSCPRCGQALDFAVPGFPCACTDCLSLWEIPAGDADGPQRPLRLPDLQSILHSDPGAAGVLKGIYGSIRSLSVIPEIPRRVIALIHDPIVGMKDVAALILDDAVLTMGLLRLVNSVAYSGREPVSDLGQACARLGLKDIANYMWASANASFYRTGPASFRKWLTRLWKHSAAAAECAQMLSQSIHLEQAHLAYVGALLHDAGKVVLLQAICNLPREASDAYVRSHQDARSLLEKYHAAVGLHTVQYMKTPPEVRSTTLYHHMPESAANPGAVRLARVVACANLLATEAGYDSHPSDAPPDAAGDCQHSLLTDLGLDEDAILAIREAVPERIESVLSTFIVD